MDYTSLGRTGLKASVMGLGCGGHSRLGISQGRGEKAAIEVVHAALDLGINYIDTAEAYGTEGIVGQAIKAVKREDVIISTKKSLAKDGKQVSLRAAELMQGLEASLKRLETDYIDIYNLHGLKARDYDYALTELVPALERAREQGKIRFIGVTEAFVEEPAHPMLEMALKDERWEVFMVGFNLLNQTARKNIFPETRARQVGVQLMFAVRRALKNFETLKEALGELAQTGQIDPDRFDPEKPLGFLLEDGKADSLTEAAYRFCRYEPGVEVVLVGTGSIDHLKANAASLLKPPLPEADVTRLKQLFERVENYTGN
jgi:L-galactose dehydrogenase